MVAYTFRMPAGIVGEITRQQNIAVEPAMLAAAQYPTAYGVFVRYNTSGLLIACQAAGDVAAGIVFGVIVRPYPTAAGASGPSYTFGGGVPSLTDTASFLRSGYVNVKLARGTGVRGAPVYMRTTAGAYTLGDIEDSTNGGSITLVPNCFFMGGADGSGNVEISVNI